MIIKHLRFQTSQKSEIYSHSRAPCAAARWCWLSAIYIRTGQHIRCIFRTFCTFCTLTYVLFQEKTPMLLFLTSFILFGQHLIVPLLIYLHISYAVNELNHTAHSDDFVCKINDFYRHYTHFARFSCRMCLYLIKIKVKPMSNL